MTISTCFWIAMLLWLVLGAAPAVFAKGEQRSWGGVGAALLPFLAVALLGWAVFGAAIR